MTSTSTDVISSDPLKVDPPQQQKQQQQQQLPYENDDVLDILKQQDSQADINTWADYWYYKIGVNVIPANSKIKRPNVPSWKNWQDSPITNEQHEHWKKDGSYKNGIAVIAGKIWRGPHKDKYLVGIDLDNRRGIDEFIGQCFPDMKTLQELSQTTIVEQHLDNKDKAHVYFIVEKSLTNRGSINGINKRDDEIPVIEIKSEGKSFVICSPSIHKDGSIYEVIGTKTPAVLNKNQSEQLQLSLNQIYIKYEKTGNRNTNGLTPIAELFQDDYVANEGSRHHNLLRVMDSIIQKHRQTLPLEQIKEIGYLWNQKHCQPPLDDKEVEKQWKSALKFIEHNSAPGYSAKILENRLITKKTHDNPEVFYYADLEGKRIGKYYIKVSEQKDGESISIPIFTDVIIDAIPEKIIVYKDNPLLSRNLERIKIIFQSSIYKDFEIGPYDNNEAIIKELENKHLILNKKNANEALACIINAFKDIGRIENVDGLTTGGYYLLNGKVRVVGITQNIESDLDEQKVRQCIKFLDYLGIRGWKNKNIFPTVLKWALVAPFSFSIKFNSDDWFPWLQLYGLGQTGKTTLGHLVLSIWSLDTRTKSLGFTHIDSVARFGHTISKDTYPILINEVGPLSTNTYGKYTSIAEILKHSVENTISRGKFVEGKDYREILALSPMILTSNYTPPSDGSYNRRFISIHFPEDEKKEVEEQEEFKKLLDDHKKSLSVLGDYSARYIIDNPSLLTTKKWTDVAKEILEHFYGFAKVPVPDWIYYFEEQRDAIDESSEKTLFGLRSFLINKINDVYARNKKYNPTDAEINADIDSKLDFCIAKKLIPFLSGPEDDILIITVDIMKELKSNLMSIENLTALKDVGQQLGFEYVNKYVHGKKMRVLEGTRGNFIKFIDAELK